MNVIASVWCLVAIGFTGTDMQLPAGIVARFATEADCRSFMGQMIAPSTPNLRCIEGHNVIVTK